MEYFRNDEIVAAGEDEVLIRFLQEERNLDCIGLTLEEIHEHFPGYEVDEDDYLLYTYLIGKNGKVDLGWERGKDQLID